MRSSWYQQFEITVFEVSRNQAGSVGLKRSFLKGGTQAHTCKIKYGFKIKNCKNKAKQLLHIGITCLLEDTFSKPNSA